MERAEVGESHTKNNCRRKSHDVIRCARAAMLLLSLRTCREKQEKEMMRQTVEDLRVEVVRERIQRKKVKLCNLMELVLQIFFLSYLCTFFLMLAFKFC